MTTAELRALVASVPQVELVEPPEVMRAVDDQVSYLESSEALATVAQDVYWPKWTGPWWSMLLLHELGMTDRIPSRSVAAMVDGLVATPLHCFPIRPEDVPPGVDPNSGLCHCAVGCMSPLLTALGVDVERALPWLAPWYERYQMADGGYNCDESAYLVEGECPSSMVGTVALFEAMLQRGPAPSRDRAAQFLIERELCRGSSTQHNAAERTAAESWSEACFPRFYFYDVLRGLTALIRWARLHDRRLPLGAIAGVVEGLVARSPDGIVHIGRAPCAGKNTRAFEGGAWTRRPASVGPLLELVSRPGAASPALTRSWSQTRRDLLALIDAGQIAG